MSEKMVSVPGSLRPQQWHNFHNLHSSGSGRREGAGTSGHSPSVGKSGSLSESAWCSSW